MIDSRQYDNCYSKGKYSFKKYFRLLVYCVKKKCKSVDLDLEEQVKTFLLSL